MVVVYKYIVENVCWWIQPHHTPQQLDNAGFLTLLHVQIKYSTVLTMGSQKTCLCV